jgi:hypothetical protein
MDFWRYSDWAGWTDGKQVRDSQRHIWRWRDWIVESLNADKGYDRMIVEMLAGDELAPEDPATLRATGFLVRNYKMLSREQWLEDTVKHTCARPFSESRSAAPSATITKRIRFRRRITIRCARSSSRIRSGPIGCRGELDREKGGIVACMMSRSRRRPISSTAGTSRSRTRKRIMLPATPRALCGDKLDPKLTNRPGQPSAVAANPDNAGLRDRGLDRRQRAGLDASARALAKAQADAATNAGRSCGTRFSKCKSPTRNMPRCSRSWPRKSCEDRGAKGTDEWRAAATERRQTTRPRRT